MDDVLREAERRGEFENLQGKGQPLSLQGGDPFGGPEAEVYRYLKEAGVVPEWVELRKQIAEAIAWLRENPNHPERVSRIVEVNLAIDRHNRLVSNLSLAFPKVPKDFGL